MKRGEVEGVRKARGRGGIEQFFFFYFSLFLRFGRVLNFKKIEGREEKKVEHARTRVKKKDEKRRSEKKTMYEAARNFTFGRLVNELLFVF